MLFCLLFSIVHTMYHRIRVKRKKACRACDEPLSVMTLHTCTGFVPRDFQNLELRHHQVFTFIIVIILSFL